MVNWVLVALGAAVVAVGILEVWGRRQPSRLLVSRAALRESIELLRMRGIDGTALIILLPEREWRLMLRKRVAPGEAVSFLLRAERVPTSPTALTVAEAERARDRLSDALRGAAPEQLLVDVSVPGSVDDVMRQLDDAATLLRSRLFPGSHARFSGSVLAFNIPERTGVAD